MPHLLLFLLLLPLLLLLSSALNSSTPDPAIDLLHRLSFARRRMLSTPSASCLTGNPIDDCWRCDPDWASNRQRLADCSLGFGRGALGGKNGRLYVVSDSSDDSPSDPKPHTLRHAVVQDEPLWIVFSSSMTVSLSAELLVNSFKTIDARGASVHVTGRGCITLQYISNVIIHGLHVHDCTPSSPTVVRSTPTHAGLRSRSDGDAISVYGSRKIWIDHCSLSHCADGLIDAIMGSTAITISNNYFSHHNDVMLLGHSDDYTPDAAMQVTIAFNVFGPGLVQRMPRCRLGYFHVVNNDFTGWEMYAIGGSAGPTVNSQGNRYTAPGDPGAKEVTKRVDTAEGKWEGWEWRSEGDEMVNGAVFVTSGEGQGGSYAKASSMEPKSTGMVDRITMNAGVIGENWRNNDPNPGASYAGVGSNSHGGGGGNSAEGAAYSGYLGMVFAGRNGFTSAAASRPSHLIFSHFQTCAVASLLYLFFLVSHLHG